ncbi:hypothetical protein ACFPRL_02415 [Pseudoclavibacter helvolus]
MRVDVLDDAVENRDHGSSFANDPCRSGTCAPDHRGQIRSSRAGAANRPEFHREERAITS